MSRKAHLPLRFWRAWQRFWFQPQPTSSLGLFRIAFGMVATGWTVSLIPNLFAFYGPAGIQPQRPTLATGEWGLLALSDSRVLLLGVFSATLAGAVAVTLGLYTRVATIVLWVGILSFDQRNGLVTNSGDGVLRDLAFFLALAPAGAALSLDRLRKAPSTFWEFPVRAPWAWRLIQIQISVGYLAAVWHKAHNDLWTNGTAVSYALRMVDIDRLTAPGFITHSVLLVNLLTYGTLAIEFSLGVLVWNRTARPWVLVAGVCLHLGIESSILVGFFSYTMIAAYITFIPPETTIRVVLSSRNLFARWRNRAVAWRATALGSPAKPGVPSFSPDPIGLAYIAHEGSMAARTNESHSLEERLSRRPKPFPWTPTAHDQPPLRK